MNHMNQTIHRLNHHDPCHVLHISLPLLAAASLFDPEVFRDRSQRLRRCSAAVGCDRGTIVAPCHLGQCRLASAHLEKSDVNGADLM